jgi:cytidylate kinase
MEMSRESLHALAERIYNLDTEVYRCVGSSLGRVLVGDRDACVDNLTNLMITRPQGHELRSQIALIANMARTISSKEDRKRLMSEYNEILKQIAEIPSSFGSIDIMDQTLAGLNFSNLHQNFSKDDHLIICISRSHGSAGTDIGFALADALKINYYDVEVFHEIMARMEEEKANDYVKKQRALEEFLKNSPHHTKSAAAVEKRLTDFDRYHGIPKQDASFFNLSDFICEMARKEDFIVMGRCADVILSNNNIPHISIFITAPFELRLRRLMALKNLDYKQARKQLLKLDKQHQRYYHFYTGRKWGDAINYDLCINSAAYGINESVELIERMIDKIPKEN